MAPSRRSCILDAMGDNTFRYGRAAPGARAHGAGAVEGARQAALHVLESASDTSRGTVETRIPEPGQADSSPAGTPPGKAGTAATRPGKGMGVGEPATGRAAGRRGVSRTVAVAGRAVAGRGGVHGHGGYASAPLDRIPAARRSQDGGHDDGRDAARRQGNEQGRHQEEAATYWRRRFIILAVSLSLLAAASWALSQALRMSPSGTSHSSGQSGPDSGSGGGTKTAQSGTGQARAPASHGTAGDAAGQASPAGKKAGASRVAAQQRPAPRPSGTQSGFGGIKPPVCSWHSIVLSLSATQVNFGPGQQPSFSLSVVSTQRSACSLDIGPSHLALVMQEGPARIWSSADCVNGPDNLVALQRGVPTVVTIEWNRKTSSPGCSGPGRSVPAGSYTGYAVDGSLISAPVPIRLN